MNIYTAINNANKILEKNGIKTSHLDCELLMSKAIKSKKENILMNLDKQLTRENLYYFNYLIQQRSKRKPIAYLINKKEFWKNEFYVSEDVLIPRPDTEIIVEQALSLTKHKFQLNILDIGVGSGCIILSILKERKSFYGTGIDVSKKSINICKINSNKLGLCSRLRLFKSDVDNFDYGKYDLIISNPPYIKKNLLKYLEKDVVGFEPKLALDGGLEGLSEIRKVIKKSSVLIKKNGVLILEIGFDQKNQIKMILKKEGFYIDKIVKDLSNNDRCIISRKI